MASDLKTEITGNSFIPPSIDWSQVDQIEFKELLRAVMTKLPTKDLVRFSQGTLLAFFAFLCYLELNPKIGGIFFRPWSDGRKYFNPMGVTPVLKYPFQSLEFWKPENWDLNFITFSLLGGGAFLTISKVLDQMNKETS